MAPKLVELDPASIVRSPYQVRKVFAAREIEELARSLRTYGMLQPVVVRETPGGYELIAGERRLRAAQLAGLSSIPAVVRAEPAVESAALGIVENVQRANLNVFEEADGYRRLMAEFGWSQSELAQRIGKSQSAVANKLRLLRLGEEIRELAAGGVLGERHLRALLRVAGVRRLELARQAAAEGWTAQEVEARARSISREIPRKVVRDVRIVLNTLKDSVQKLRAAGVAVEMTEEEADDALEVRIRIPRR